MCRFTFGVFVTLALTASAKESNKCETGDESSVMASSANMLLQTKGVTRKHISAHEVEKDTSNPTTEDVYYDGMTPIHGEIHSMNRNPIDMFISYDIASNGIQVVNGTAFFPLYSEVQASFIRRFHASGDEEVGWMKQAIGYQPYGGALSSNLRSGVGEKIHILKRKHRSDQTAYNRSLAHPPPSHLDAATRVAMAKAKWGLLVTSSMLSKIGIQSVQAAAVPVLSNRGSLGSDFEANYLDLKTTLTNELNSLDLGALDPLAGSQVTCMHWDGNTTFDPHRLGVVFPLDTQMTAWRGETTSAPWTAMNYMQGIQFVRVENGRLNMYFEASTESHWPDPLDEDRSPAAVWHGPGVPLDTGFNAVGQNPAAKYYFDLAHQLPKDYGVMFLPKEDLCNSEYQESVFHLLMQLLERNIIMKIGMGIATLDDQHFFLHALNEWIPCSLPYMKPDAVDSAEYGVYMATATIHTIMEVDPQYWHIFTDDNFWNGLNTATLRL